MATVIDLSGNGPPILGSAGVDYHNGQAPVTGTIASATQSVTYKPVQDSAFVCTVDGTFVATYSIERLIPGGSNWVNVARDTSGTDNAYTSPETLSLTEPVAGASYRLNVTSYTSGTLNYRFGQ